MENNDVLAQKKELRARVRALLRQISTQDFAEMGTAMARQLCETGMWQNADSVFCYYGTRYEPDTRPLLQAALAQGKRLYLPRCIPGQPGRMDLVRVRDFAQITLRPSGLWEPEGTELARARDLSLALLPCLAGCRSGGRLGHGGGYYDRFMEEFCGFSVLLCPSAALFPTLPTEPHDRDADFVLTEQTFFGAEH